MTGIPIYAKDCGDFSTNGICLLRPVSCTVEETANGLYELSMELPIGEDQRFSLVTPGAIVKAVTPVRESPLYEQEAVSQETATTTVTRSIYRVSTSSGKLRLRQKPSTSAKILSSWKKGTEVTLLEQTSSSWWKVSILKGGAVGYMSTSYLSFVRTVTETITKSRPVTQNAVKVEIAREQLFRIYSVENDTREGIQTVRAMHVFYDLRYDFVDQAYDPEGVSAAAAAANCWAHLRYAPEHALYASRLTNAVSGSYGWKNFAEALLDPDEGIVPQAGGRLFRDNFDIYLLPDEERDMGVTVRRGKNLAGVTVTTDDSNAVTRIQPCGQNANGEPLFLADGGCVDSPRIGEYPVVRAKKVDYDVKYDPNSDGTQPGVYRTLAEARAALTEAARADFAGGCDLPAYGMEVDFVLLGDTGVSSDYANLQAVHLFDTVTVIDELIGLTARLRVTGYSWNVLSEQYESVDLGEIEDLRQTTYSFNLASGSVSGSKVAGGSAGTASIANGAVTSEKLADGAVTSSKLSTAAKQSAGLTAFPVGSVYVETTNTAPSFGGTWSMFHSDSLDGTTVYYWKRTA
ncbi:MAG: phage tail protein [Clostridia bacterium]|nr:phage tail protein [Clostridia bacterium]